MKYKCVNCEHISLRWEGKCSECNEWGTLEEIEDSSSRNSKSKGRKAVQKAEVFKASELKDVDEDENYRFSTGYGEFDRVLGGGFVPGEVVLVSGEPGIGKSTLLTQVALSVSKGKKVLYVTGEESTSQFYKRLERFDLNLSDGLDVTSVREVESFLEAANGEGYSLMIVDSIQSVSSLDVDSYPGSISQVRASSQLLISFAKSNSCSMVVVGQVTKSGNVAGPKVLEHAVDAVVQFEGDSTLMFRLVRAAKNRFGSTDEVGVFQMLEEGYVEVSNPSEVFVQDSEQAAGSVVTAVLNGSRVIFFEVQALVVERGAEAGPLRRVANGLAKSRLDMLAAVMTKRGGVFLGDKDLFVNVVGGVRVDTPGIDLAVCKAIKSAVTDKVVGSDHVYIGEVGLTGAVRPFIGVDLVLSEAERLGYKKVHGVLAKSSKKAAKKSIFSNVKFVSKV